FLGHIGELRSCLRRAALGYLAGVVIAGLFAERLYVLLAWPLARALAKAKLPQDLNFSSPIEPFWVYFKVAMIFCLFFSAPVIFWHLWCFVGRGLYRREMRLVFPFTIISVFFFIGGAAFCQLVVLPLAYPFFLGYSRSIGPITIKPVLMMDPVMSFSIKMLL